MIGDGTIPVNGPALPGQELKTVFDLQCPLNIDGTSAFPEDMSNIWPTCDIQHCLENDMPILNHFTKLTNTKVKVGDFASYVCSTNGHVTDNGEKQFLECKDDGSFNDR